mmetsp:Transcript_106933/g.190091  ORF Transcript_106933/g.190091 Transcript_106933/m.190091 type:complete len:179 (-) Transcript_106933:103-639(-)
MALSRLNEDLAKALEEKGSPVESLLDTPGDTPVHRDIGSTSHFSWVPFEAFGFSAATSSSLSADGEYLPSTSTSGLSLETPSFPMEDPRSHKIEDSACLIPSHCDRKFLFTGACLRPYQEGSLGERSLLDRVRHSEELRKDLMARSQGKAEKAQVHAASLLMRNAAVAAQLASPDRKE